MSSLGAYFKMSSASLAVAMFVAVRRSNQARLFKLIDCWAPGEKELTNGALTAPNSVARLALAPLKIIRSRQFKSNPQTPTNRPTFGRCVTLLGLLLRSQLALPDARTFFRLHDDERGPCAKVQSEAVKQQQLNQLLFLVASFPSNRRPTSDPI